MLLETCVDKKLSLELSNGNVQLAIDMLTVLLAELAQNHRDIHCAFAESRFDDALELIHKLHGACCYCGVPVLKAACKQLEVQLHQQRRLPVADDIQRFDKAVQTLMAWQCTHKINDFFYDDL